ncbi:unnamed protein product [Cylicocyclus nassatus]|uniref:SCP domain-containing protein n=1 Tax=Cylicocyclus nassatus TaxID=53992 RepID=A0AA36M949_CYLNA|nr:unnamed protein product [Cylicocyclus nassatus]
MAKIGTEDLAIMFKELIREDQKSLRELMREERQEMMETFLQHIAGTGQPTFCPDGKLEESDIEAALANINEKRSNVVKGDAGPLPAGKNMNKIVSDIDNQKVIKYLHYEDDNPVDEVNEGWYNQGLAADNLESLIDSGKSKVTYNSDSYSATEFTNPIRASTTELGCARASGDCDDIYVLCFTNQPQLENGYTIYEVGDGACTSEAGCDPGTSCDTGTGLCEIAAETTTTAAKETATIKPASYPGELPSGTNTQCSSNVGMTDELRMQFLDTQNYRRSILAKGGQVKRPRNILPSGANIIKLVLLPMVRIIQSKLNFNCTLEEEAIQEVRQCFASKTPHSKYGKNFNTFASSTVVSTYKDAVKKAVTNWWKVVRTESNGPGMQVTFRSNHVNQPVES